MKASDKAREIFLAYTKDSFVGSSYNSTKAKYAGKIAINIVLEEIVKLEEETKLDLSHRSKYWMNVKMELTKL
jgi:hypothetical protein